MSDWEVHFDLGSFLELDSLTLLATQDYNFGSTGGWFGEFRDGLYGFYARLYGVQRHYSDVHTWLPRGRNRSDFEYNLASILFHMDSALECLTFALNAFGWAVMPEGFRNITKANELRWISPYDLLGTPPNIRPLEPNGYAKLFPTLQKKWQSQEHLFATIRDLHDVSKHRRTIFIGGQHRTDPPDRFYDAIGISEDENRAVLLWPMAEILLPYDPKLPAAERSPRQRQHYELLENLVPSFAELIKRSGETVLADARANVPLNESQFRQ